MQTGELEKRAASFLNALIAWPRRLSLFALAVAFAVCAHVVFAYLLVGLKLAGVDFAALDPGRILIPAAQISLFAAQAGLIVAALIKSGLDMGRTITAISALLWAASMLMLTFVSTQCDLFGACL